MEFCPRQNQPANGIELNRDLLAQAKQLRRRLELMLEQVELVLKESELRREQSQMLRQRSVLLRWKADSAASAYYEPGSDSPSRR